MAESHPFANSGLGSYGAGDSFAKAAMHPAVNKDGGMSLLGGALATLIKSFGGDDKKPEVDGSAPPPQQYEPSSAFPEVTQQQYVSPYISGGGPNQIWGNKPMQNPTYGVMPPTAPNPMAGFQTTSPYTTQPQTNPYGYHSAVDALWR
jgi:hypothetical protein